MYKTTVKIDHLFEERFLKFRKESAQVLVSMVAAEYVDLLHNAPQYSGNFVANMAIGSGQRAGRKGGKLVFPNLYKEKGGRQKAFQRGSIPAIAHAIGANANVKKNLTQHISRSAGYLTGVTVYNKLSNAEEIEGLSPDELRQVNRAGAHAMAKFGSKLEARLNTQIIYGDSNWYRYLGANYV